MDVFVSCVAQALLLCRVVLSRFMFSNARFQQGLRSTRWRRLSTSSFGEEKRCNHLGLYQVEQAKGEDVVHQQLRQWRPRATKAENALAEVAQKQAKCEEDVVKRLDGILTSVGSKFFPYCCLLSVYWPVLTLIVNFMMQQSNLET
jgi:hypothetical protein